MARSWGIFEPVLQERQPLELREAGDLLHRRPGHVGVGREVEFDQIREGLHDLLDTRIRKGAVGERQRVEALQARQLLHHFIVEDAAVEDLQRPQIAESAEDRHVVGREFGAVLDRDLGQAALAVELVFGIFPEAIEAGFRRRRIGGRRLRRGKPASCGKQHGRCQQQRHKSSHATALHRIVHVSLVEG